MFKAISRKILVAPYRPSRYKETGGLRVQGRYQPQPGTGNELTPLVSIIIPARNAADCIGNCLSALSRQTIPRHQFEIIVVDDGSEDDTAAVAESHDVLVLRMRPAGPARARNAGVERANSAILLFTDADCTPRINWVERMVAAFDDPDVAGVKGVYQSTQKEVVAQFVQFEYERKYAYMAQFPEIDFIDTYSAGFRRDVFRKLGGFDTTFPEASVEDQEFSFRMHSAGHRMIFLQDAIVNHLHANGFMGYFKKKFRIGYWKVKVLKLHPGKITHDTHTPQSLKMQIPAAFLFALSLPLVPLGFFPITALFAMIFIGLGFPETLICHQKGGLKLALLSPWIMLLRSWGLGLGLLAGISRLW